MTVSILGIEPRKGTGGLSVPNTEFNLIPIFSIALSGPSAIHGLIVPYLAGMEEGI